MDFFYFYFLHVWILAFNSVKASNYMQVLPDLMKSLAQLIVQLPVSGQNVLLNQLYQQIADSDDVIRKPALVSWVQSLSYLCSQGTDRKRRELVGQSASARL